MYVLLIAITCIKTGLAAKCFQCSATTQEICLHGQTLTECNQCMTLTYTENEDNVDVSYYVKRCSDSRERCENLCKRNTGFTAVKNCQTFCCNTDFCNKKISKKTMTKRSNNSSAGQQIQTKNALIQFVVLMGTWLYLILP